MKLRVPAGLLTSCILLAATTTFGQYVHNSGFPVNHPPSPGWDNTSASWPATTQQTQPPAGGPAYRVSQPAAANQVSSPNPYAADPYVSNPYPANPYPAPHAPVTQPPATQPIVTQPVANQPGGDGQFRPAAVPPSPTANWQYATAPIPAQRVPPSPAPSGLQRVPAIHPAWSNPPPTGLFTTQPASPRPAVPMVQYGVTSTMGGEATAHDAAPEATKAIHGGGGKRPWTQEASCSSCGNLACGGGQCGPNNGVYFQYDRVYWSISAPRTTDIGHAPSERIVTTPAGITLFYQNDLDTSFLDHDFSTGDRFDFGYLNGNWGWAASILYVRQRQSVNATGVSYVPFDPGGLMSGYQDSNGDTFDDDLDFDNLFGRNGEDLGTPDGAGGFVAPFDGIPDTSAPADTGDLVTYLVTFGSMSAHNNTEMTGAELMNIYRTAGSNGDHTLDWYYGMRFLKIRDRFMISGSGGFLDPMTLDTDVVNDIVGPQIGGRWSHRMGSLVLSVEGRCLLGYNFQRSEQSGHVATNASPGGQNAPVSLTAHTANQALTDEQFAPLGELRFDMAYKINRTAAFRFGYTALVTTGIGRASEQVVYGLPTFGLNAADNDQTLFSNALTFGLELNR